MRPGRFPDGVLSASSYESHPDRYWPRSDPKGRGPANGRLYQPACCQVSFQILKRRRGLRAIQQAPEYAELESIAHLKPVKQSVDECRASGTQVKLGIMGAGIENIAGYEKAAVGVVQESVLKGSLVAFRLD